jgi:hypothetical protein
MALAAMMAAALHDRVSETLATRQFSHLKKRKASERPVSFFASSSTLNRTRK